MKTLTILLTIITAATMFTSCANNSTEHQDQPEITTAETTVATTAKPVVKEEPQYIEHEKAFNIAVNYALTAYANESDSFLEYYSADRIGWSVIFDGCIYTVNFETPEYEYNCEIDPVTGEISNFTRDLNDVFDPEIVGRIHVEISEEEALTAALDFLELSKEDVSDTKSVYNEEQYAFEVSFSYDGTEYVCEVDYKGGFMRSNIDIGPNGAKEIAFEHMLDSADNYMMRDDLVNFTLAGLMTNLGTNIIGGREDRRYQISFSVGGFTYYYNIDGLSGEILQYDRNNDPTWIRDPAGAGYGNYIPQYIVSKTALDDAGIGINDYHFRRITLDTTDRQERYIVYFETDEYAYEYEIDAYSGDILSSEQSELVG